MQNRLCRICYGYHLQHVCVCWGGGGCGLLHVSPLQHPLPHLIPEMIQQQRLLIGLLLPPRPSSKPHPPKA
jgi:hypothetical protein